MKTQKCYKQIVGPHATLEDAIQKCNELENDCNGIQYVKCKGNNFRITKSLFDAPCTTKPAYTRNPNCDITLYEKGNAFLKELHKKIIELIPSCTKFKVDSVCWYSFMNFSSSNLTSICTNYSEGAATTDRNNKNDLSRYKEFHLAKSNLLHTKENPQG